MSVTLTVSNTVWWTGLCRVKFKVVTWYVTYIDVGFCLYNEEEGIKRATRYVVIELIL